MESCEYRKDLSDAKLRELLELPLAERAGALPIWSSAAPINAQVQARGYAQQKMIYMETDEALPPVLPSLPTTTTTTSRRRRARRPRGLPGLLQLFPYMHHARCSAAPFAHGLEGSRPQPKLITTLHYNQN